VNTPPSQKAQAEGQAADLSRWARRKPAGALQVSVRRQFTFPEKPDAPRASKS